MIQSTVALTATLILDEGKVGIEVKTADGKGLRIPDAKAAATDSELGVLVTLLVNKAKEELNSFTLPVKSPSA